MNRPRILAFAGSTRSESFNKKLVAAAAEAARRAGAEVTVIDLRDLDLPLYDQDQEAEHGLPAGAVELKRLMEAHDGLLISSPEYNSSLSAVLKNALDWASRKGSPDEAPLAAFDGKVAALLSASPGGLGGLRGLVHLRAILGNLRVLVIPEQKAVSSAYEAFADDGSLASAANQKAVDAIAIRLVEILRRLA